MSDKLFDDIKAALEEASKHPGFYSVSYQEPIVSDIELRIRKEVMKLMNQFGDKLQQECDNYRDYYGYGCGYSEDRL